MKTDTLPAAARHLAGGWGPGDSTSWWIATDLLRRGGRKILGPFGSRDLALEVRGYVEKVHRTDQYFVDSE